MKYKLTPPELASRWGISPDKVVTWIRNGELRAIDGSATRSRRPRYLIDVADIAAFERARQIVQTPVSASRRRKRQKQTPRYV